MLKKKVKSLPEPMVDVIITHHGTDPYLILISCLLSLRAKDTTTLPVCLNLFDQITTPEQMIKIPLHELEKLVYKTGFFRQKARTLKSVSVDLLQRFEGKVPNDKKLLESIKGVGAKTAGLVLYKAFQISALIVDTHVHRVSNRLGIVKTKTPAQTYKELETVIPQKYWGEWSHLLVIWGQNICVPISPFCTKCAISDLCPRIGVKRFR